MSLTSATRGKLFDVDRKSDREIGVNPQKIDFERGAEFSVGAWGA